MYLLYINLFVISCSNKKKNNIFFIYYTISTLYNLMRLYFIATLIINEFKECLFLTNFDIQLWSSFNFDIRQFSRS